MTRKQYIRRMTELVTAIHSQAGGKRVDGTPWKLGESLKYVRDHAKQAVEECGSYQTIWDNMKPARDLYGTK